MAVLDSLSPERQVSKGAEQDTLGMRYKRHISSDNASSVNLDSLHKMPVHFGNGEKCDGSKI